MTSQAQTLPAGYMQDAKGRLVPISSVKPIDLLREDLVLQLVEQAKQLNQALTNFKAVAFGDIAAFVQTSAEQYGAALGGKKGNVTLHSYDGRYKIVRQAQDNIRFDERLQAAQALINECLTEWSEGSRVEIKTLINDAFRVDQEGQVNTGRVLALQRLDIKSEKWSRAMDAIRDSVQVVGSSSYVRVYERIENTDQYRPIALDLASV
jgi:aminopeptidase N